MKATAKRTLTPRAVVLATAAAVALIGGTGAATAFANDDGPAPQSSVQLPHNERHLDDTAKDRAQVKADKISQSQATAKALQAVPGTATSAELDDDDRNGSLVWEVEVLGKDHKSHEVIIDAGSGKVLNQHIDHDDHDNNDNQDDNDSDDD
ncbi:PepSY domain-containing protein [Streptomyces nigrescens]|uniref:PepSY domain-containing protein n=1 Tax=Streptomyces nigrescens TaxID=1920 RepID=A0ABY7J7N0_STRNI|nr:PepSY domain-containing protein [Streptomyces nigrescens]WAU05751.1 PepSY domain-containing protein [Streptomyces nigrescens]